MTTEQRAREIIRRYQSMPAEPSREQVRSVMAGRVVEVLETRRTQFKTVERRAVSLMQRVDYSNIRPWLVPVAPRDALLWDYLRCVVSSAPWRGRKGRTLKLLSIDKNTGGVIGIAELGGEMQAGKLRDEAIGWSSECRWRRQRINHVANLGTCVATAGFGPLTGGKFIASAVTSSEITGLWGKVYGDSLAALTTTSLYGKSSQYERLREWSFLGLGYGVGSFHVSDDDHRVLQRFTRENATVKIGLALEALGDRGRLGVLRTAAKLLGMGQDDVTSHQARGFYFADLGGTTLPFLRCERNTLTRDTEPLEAKVDHWLERWYSMRWPKVADDVQQFDATMYRLDRRLDECKALARGRSVDGDTPIHRVGDAGSTPADRSEVDHVQESVQDQSDKGTRGMK